MTALITLIPAYKVEHLGDLLLGLRTQSFTDFRVVLSDDSPDGVITERIRSGAFDALIDKLDLAVIQGPRHGSLKNVQHLLKHCDTETALVHLHMDDDVIYPDFYRQHAMAHASATLAASVSQRWLTAPDGRPVSALPLPALVDEQPHRVLAVGPDALFATTIPTCQNWLGEFSNTVLSQAAVRRLTTARLGGLSYYGLADIGILLDASREAPIGFLRDHLSGFRSHPRQSTAQAQSHGLMCGYLAWVALALGAHREKLIDERQLQSALAVTTRNLMDRYGATATLAEYFAMAQRHATVPAAMLAPFTAYWHGLLQTNSDSCEEPRSEAVATPA